MSRTALLFRIAGDLRRVEGRTCVLGRSRECDVQVDGKGVSRRHTEVRMSESGVAIVDLQSKHGTWVQGQQVSDEPRMLRAGMNFRMGRKGPKIEFAGALLDGRKLRSDGKGFEKPSRAAPAEGSGRAKDSAAVAGSRGGFGKGLVWGLVVGLLVGVAAVAVVDTRPLVARAREAFGLE